MAGQGSALKATEPCPVIFCPPGRQRFFHLDDTRILFSTHRRAFARWFPPGANLWQPFRCLIALLAAPL